jgi:hypothetical protein
MEILNHMIVKMHSSILQPLYQQSTCQILRKLQMLGMIVMLVAGCNRQPAVNGPVPHPVCGKIVYKGQPAQKFHVAFHPVTKWQGVQFAPATNTDDNGEFQLQSYHPGDGAPVGEYLVTFSWPDPPLTPDNDAPSVDKLQGRYADPKKSKYRVTIHEGKNVLEPFVLQ